MYANKAAWCNGKHTARTFGGTGSSPVAAIGLFIEFNPFLICVVPGENKFARYRNVAQLVSAPVLYTVGRGFESYHSD